MLLDNKCVSVCNLSECKVNASHIHGKLVNCTKQIFDYLYFYSKYQHMSSQKQVTEMLYAMSVPHIIGKMPGGYVYDW